MPVEPMQWEQKVLASYRWGRYSEATARDELARLRPLYDAVAPLNDTHAQILGHVLALEVCNWRLEGSIIDLCGAIGTAQVPANPVGHKASVTDDRWIKIWAYYLALRDWLPGPLPPLHRGYQALLAQCDPGREAQTWAETMLGDKTDLKALYVELFCLGFQELIEGDWGSAPLRYVQAMANWHAREQVIEQIQEHDGDDRLVNAITRGNFQPCHHKLFRHLDIVISSIGAGKWRGAMPRRGMDGFGRADILETHLDPMKTWLEGTQPGKDQIAAEIHRLLGQRDETKAFLIALFISLLRAQQQAARERADKRAIGE